MADDKRIDLGAELGGLGASDDLIADIKKAAGAEKLRIDAVQTKERKVARSQASKKLYVVVAVVAALVLIMVAAIATNRPEPAKIGRQMNRTSAPTATVRQTIPGAATGRIAPPAYNPQGAAPPPEQNSTGYEQPPSPM